MEKFRVRFIFDKDNSKTLEIEVETKEQLIDKLTRDDWYISDDGENVINMKVVTRLVIGSDRPRARAITGF
ncbi:hypothetical protein [Halalkalibacter flavus]|uniref:hypothetical protein n=1 Tax=Halalkalibacter flavus TaxID=3090668 RepID=UPI002FC89350